MLYFILQIMKEIREEHDRLSDHSTTLTSVHLETLASGSVDTDTELMQFDQSLADEVPDQNKDHDPSVQDQELEFESTYSSTLINAGPSTSTQVTTFLESTEREAFPLDQTTDQCDNSPEDCKTCDNLQTENKDLKAQIKSLKTKVTRLKNRMALNQKQWVETFQNQTQQDQQDSTATPFGTPTENEVEPTPIPEESDQLDDYDDAEESDHGAPIYDEDPTWTLEDVDEVYTKLGDDCDDKKQTTNLQLTRQGAVQESSSWPSRKHSPIC